MAYLLAGPFVAVIGIAAVFFVLRRKSVEKHSMYSARRSQIEHKVRAARQRTLAGHGHAEKPAEGAPAAVSPFDQTQVQPTVTYEAPLYQAPPVAPPPAPPQRAEPAQEPLPWEQAPIPPSVAAPAQFDYPPARPEPSTPPVEPFRPAAEPAPSEPVWTPAPRPAEPMAPVEPVAPIAAATSSTSSTAAGGWSIVNTAKDSDLTPVPSRKKSKDKRGEPEGAWQLASGEAPGAEEDSDVRRPSGTVVAVAQYAVLVVGLVMVLIGVLVMVANSHVT